MKRILISLVFVLLAVALVPSTQAQGPGPEPDETWPIGNCTAFFHIGADVLMRQVDQDTGEGIYDAPVRAHPGDVLRFGGRWQHTIVHQWWLSEGWVMQRPLICPGENAWRQFLPSVEAP